MNMRTKSYIYVNSIKQHSTYLYKYDYNKSPKYTCLQIWNVENVKVIDWICTWSKL